LARIFFGYPVTILTIKSLKSIEGNIFPVKKASMYSKDSSGVRPIGSHGNFKELKCYEKRKFFINFLYYFW